MYIKGQKGHLFLCPQAVSLTEMINYTGNISQLEETPDDLDKAQKRVTGSVRTWRSHDQD